MNPAALPEFEIVVMPIPVICSCKAKLRVADKLRGKLIQCPKCSNVYSVNTTGATPWKAAGPVVRSAEDLLAESGLSAEERERLEKALEGGEKLLWAGKPQTKPPFLQALGPASGFLFSAVVVGIMFFIIQNSNMLTGGMQFLPLVGVGGFVLAAGVWPFLVKRRYARTAYAVTSGRALAWDPHIFGWMRFQEYDAADLARFYRVKVHFGGRDEAGSLIFGGEASKKKGEGHKVVRYHGFFYIGRAAEVEKLIRERLVNPYTDRLYQ